MLYIVYIFFPTRKFTRIAVSDVLFFFFAIAEGFTLCVFVCRPV